MRSVASFWNCTTKSNVQEAWSNLITRHEVREKLEPVSGGIQRVPSGHAGSREDAEHILFLSHRCNSWGRPELQGQALTTRPPAASGPSQTLTFSLNTGLSLDLGSALGLGLVPVSKD
jgi:hypothetical protein